jgi:dephospho-CoA kinase
MAMLHVGLTGNVASGKSAVSARLAAHGARVLDADRYARDAVAPGTPALARIVARFGPGVLEPGGALDRAGLARVVFRDPNARRDLEAIVHPEVARLRAAELATARAAGEQVVVSDVPLLFEAGLAKEFDVIVLVHSPDAMRLDRLVRERGMSEADARAVMDAQGDADAKRARAHHVLENGGSLDDLHRQVDVLWTHLRARANADRSS